MSEFSTYARRVDKIAKTAFAEYTEAENALKNAEAEVKKYPQHHGGVDYEYAARSARAQADLMDARKALHTAQMKLNDGVRDIAAVRRELAAALNDEYSADPSQIDSGILELLKSGILTATEYAKLLNAAQNDGNHTMARLITKHAATAAESTEKQYGHSSQQAEEFRAIAYKGNTDPVGSKLGMFDVLVDVYQRTVNNTAMIGHWDELTKRIIENL